MTTGAWIRGEFLDVYPYMNWIFLLTQEGDLLYSRTESLIKEEILHNNLFRQNLANNSKYSQTDDLIELPLTKFKKIAKVADKFSFSDLRFFYSNIFCGSNQGLQFLSFDTDTEKVCNDVVLTDAPISSISAKYMTVFASSLEGGVTTLFGVRSGGYSRIGNAGPETTRVGVSDRNIHYYLGGADLQLANYTRSKPSNREQRSVDEGDREEINAIGEVESFECNDFERPPEFIFNSNDGIYFKIKKTLHYYKISSEKWFAFPLDVDGRLIKAHLLWGKNCYEFLHGLYMVNGKDLTLLLEGECISSRGYANSINYRDTISAVTDDGAYLFKV